jgi:hypothetical protein
MELSGDESATWGICKGVGRKSYYLVTIKNLGIQTAAIQTVLTFVYIVQIYHGDFQTVLAKNPTKIFSTFSQTT